MTLPNGHRAEIGDKIESYTLNPFHREGRHKARVFASALGVSLENAGILRTSVLNAAASLDGVQDRGDNGFGQVFVLRFPMTTDKGSAVVLTAWIIRRDEDFPRLTTCYIV